MPTKRAILERLLEEVLKLQRQFAGVEKRIDQLERSFVPFPMYPTQPTDPTLPMSPGWPGKLSMPIVVMYGCQMDYNGDGTLAIPPKYTMTTTDGPTVVLTTSDSPDPKKK
jgi:hypothetical protein